MNKSKFNTAKLIKIMSVVAAAILFSVGSAARAQIIIVNNNNLDAAVAHESTTSSQTEGVKDGAGENNGGGTTITNDSGAEGYWQGFQTGLGGDINLLTLDLTVVASSPGVNKNVSNPDTATFYLYSFPGANISNGRQIGPAIATVTAAEIESGTPVGYSSNNSSDVYQYTLISSLSSYDLLANTDYAIVMMTSSGSQDVGWAESNTKATGDMGEFDHINTGGNNGGAYGQMELVETPEPSTWALMLGGLSLVVFWRTRRARV